MLIRKAVFLFFLLAACLIAGALPVSAAADDAEEEKKAEAAPVGAAIAMPDFSGYLQFRFTSANNTPADDTDQDGFSLQMLRLKAKGDDLPLKIKKVKSFYVLQADLASGALSLKDAYFGWKWLDELVLTLGQFKLPFGWAARNSEDKMLFADRPRLAKIQLGRDIGVMLAGRYVFFSDFGASYSAAAANGEGENSLQRNADEKYLYAGAVEFEPLGEVEANESDLTGESPLRLSLGGGIAYTDSTGRGETFERRRQETRYSAVLRCKYQGLSLTAEYLRGFVDEMRTAERTAEGFSRYGHYIQVGYLPYFAPWFELVARTEVYDYSDQDVAPLNSLDDYRNAAGFLKIEQHSFGANFYLNAHKAKFQVNYLMENLLERAPSGSKYKPLVGDRVVVQAQVAFE